MKEQESDYICMTLWKGMKMIVQRGQPYLAIDEMPNVPNSEQCKTPQDVLSNENHRYESFPPMGKDLIS